MSYSVLKAPTIQQFLASDYYTFTVTAANASVGATYTNNTQTFTVVYKIAGGTTLVCSATGAPTSSGTLTLASGTGDSSITFSSAANYGTYQLPSNPLPLYLIIKAIGGGGAGGNGGGESPGGTGGTGANTTFGTAITCNGGGGGDGAGDVGPSGGTTSISTSSSVIQIQSFAGGSGTSGSWVGSSGPVKFNGGIGASTPFGGQGYGGGGGTSAYNGGDAVANTGAGGGGGGSSSSQPGGAGGAAGGYAEVLLMSPSSTYQFTVGAGGASNSGGSGSSYGGNGGSGQITVYEYYQ